MIKTNLFSKKVSPISDIEEGKKAGQYTYVYSYITKETVPLKALTGEKRVYVVPLNRTVQDTDDITLYLAGFGLKPCVNGPQYLLGLMASTPESELPDTLKGKDIVAAENVAASVFRVKDGLRCFLRAYRYEGLRKLDLVDLDGRWHADGGWAFLAEDLDTLNDSLSPSDSSTLPETLVVNGVTYVRK